MRRSIPLMLILAIASPAVPQARAEDAPGAQELHEMRQALEQQSKQIELLAEQIGKLTRAIEAQKAPEPAAAKTAEPAPAPGPTTSIEVPKPGGDPAAEVVKTEAVPKAVAVPAAEAAGGGVRHVVAKGETLTSIAKHYNITIADLKNANKIENERKLQIGQILSVPTPKPADTSDKKENP